MRKVSKNQKASKKHTPRFCHADVWSVHRMISAFSAVWNTRQVFRLRRHRIRLVFPWSIHSDIIQPELCHHGGGPARDLHPFPYYTGPHSAAGHLVFIFCQDTISDNISQ